MALPNGTVGTFLLVLTSKLTQWDARYNKSPYALGIMLGAADEVRQEVEHLLESDRPEDLRKLQVSIERHFTRMRWRDSVLKQIDDFIATGKKPTMTGKVRGHGEMGY